MNNNEKQPFLSSPIFRKLSLGALVFTFALVLSGYYLLTIQHRNDVKDSYVKQFNLIADGLEKTLKRNGKLTQSALESYGNMDVSSRLILFVPDGSSMYVEHSVNREVVSFSLPQLNTSESENNLVKDGILSTWRDLGGNYRFYGQIKLPEANFWRRDKNIFWLTALALPLVFMLAALLFLAVQLRRMYGSWRDTVIYALRIENKTSYQPLKLKHDNEFKSLETVVNRLAYRFIKQQNLINQLSQVKKELVDNLPEMVFRLDPQGKITYGNRRFKRAFNIQQSDSQNTAGTNVIIDLPLTRLVQGIKPADQQQLDTLLRDPRPIKIVVKEVNTSNRHDLWVEPIYHQNSTQKNPILMGFVGLLHNITRDQSALDLLQLKQLEIDERLKANEQLWAVMGHELRTPLNGMIGMIQLLEQTAMDDEQRDFVKTLKSSSDNMLFLLNDMLDLSKLDAGKVEPVISDMDLLSLTRETCELMAGNASKKSLEIISFASPDTPRFVPGDPYRVRQILLNLMGNAIKFTETGHVSLLVESVANDHEDIQKRFLGGGDKTWICFSIEDTGPGIPEHEQEQLFMFFNQANSSISRRFGGTGLGLAISKGLAEMLGGFVTLESTVGEGTTFRVYLPFEVTNKTSMYTFPRMSNDLYLMLFDPNPLNHAYLGDVLRNIGIPAIMFDSISQEQLATLNMQPSSRLTPILVIDYELLADQSSVDKLLSLPNMKVPNKLLMSNRSPRSLPVDVMEAFDGFVSKPIFVENFLAEVLRVSEKQENLKRQAHAADSFDSMLDEVKQARKESGLDVTDAIFSSSASFGKTTGETEDTENRVTVLLAEDNKINQKVATKMLEKQGYHVIVAEDGQVCLDKLAANPEVKLIFMDCRMPKMDGLTATRKIREQQISIPIIALTANDTEEDRQACEKAGMDEFLAKPINQEKLTQLLKRYQPLLR